MTKTKATPAAQVRDESGTEARSDSPKNSLQEATRVAKAIEDANGGQPYPPTETAIALGVSPGSSNFRTLLASSLRYGLTRGSYKSDRISLEALGKSIVEPKTPEEAQQAIVSAALTPPTFRQMYDYYRGKKLPDASYLQNTVTREFGVPKEHAEACVDIFNANMEHAGLVRVATTGRWLSSEAVPATTAEPAEEPEEIDETMSAEAEEPGSPASAVERLTPAKNAIFVGHGKNKTPLGQLKAILDQYSIPYKVAVEEANEFRPISQKVADIMHSCGAAILIFTADEQFNDKDANPVWRPSENVIFELGAASVLYGRRVIMFKEDTVTFPTNFRDIGYIEFQKDNLAAKTNELFKELIAFGLIKVSVGE